MNTLSPVHLAHILSHLPPLDAILFARSHNAALEAYLKILHPKPHTRPYMARLLVTQGSEKFLMTFQPLPGPFYRGWPEDYLITLADAVVRYNSVLLLRRIVTIILSKPPVWAHYHRFTAIKGPPLRFFLFKTGMAAAKAKNKFVDQEAEDLCAQLRAFLF